MGVLELFDRGAKHNASHPCLVQEGVTRTYREVRENSQRVAAALKRAGIRESERVAVYSTNCVEAYESMLGVYRAQCVFVPANAKAHVEENILILNQCAVGALFYHPSLKVEIEKIRLACPQIRLFVSLGPALHEEASFTRWLADVKVDEELSRPAPDGALTSIYSTGGTTGQPKGVMFSSRTWDAMAANFLAAIPCESNPVFLLATPMTHGAGTTSIALLSQGATILIHEKFDAGTILAEIERREVSHLFLPPTAIYMLLDHPHLSKYDYSSLRCFIYAGAPMSVDRLKDAMAAFGPVMMQSYGQTEAPMFCTGLTPAEHVSAVNGREQILRSCGRAMLLTPVEIMDDSGRLLSPGERGEIVVRGPLVMQGYYENAAATEEASQYGWHHTGDIGSKDEEGYIYVLDRKKDMIITGGFNVYPVEVEQVLWSHPAVQDCAVVGVPDAKWGEAIKAVIQVRPGAHIDPNDLMAYCKSRLGAVKTPKSVEIWDSLPRTPVGKVSRRAVREHFWRGLDRTI